MATNANVAVSLTKNATGEKREYAVDTSFEPYRREAFRHRTIPAQRQSVQMTNITGEGTVNTEGLWRREQVEWSMGAGQFSLDRKGDNQETRFLSSKGVDVFSYPFQATLLPDTQQYYASTASNLLMSRCGDYVIVAEGTTVSRFTSGSWSGSQVAFTVDTTYGGSSLGTIYSIATNDAYVFLGTSTGLWFSNPANTEGSPAKPYFQLFAAPDSTSGYTGGYTMVRWANDQLITSTGNRLYTFQPRSATSYPKYGTAPTVGNSAVNIVAIYNDEPSSTYATVQTTDPHNLSAGQPINIADSSSAMFTSYSAYISAVSDGTVTIEFTTTNPFSSGEAINVTLQSYVTGNQIADAGVTITSSSSSMITYQTSQPSTAWSDMISSEVISIISADNTSGFNKSWVVYSVVDAYNFVISGTTDALGIASDGGTVSSSIPADLLVTHENPNWHWSDAVGGSTQVYFAGYVLTALGNKSSGCIYRSDMLGASVTSSTSIQTVSSTSATQPWNLDIPIQALPMSPDEYPTCLQAYLNYIFVGTNRGIRMTQTLSIYDPTATNTGDLKSGPLIPNILQPVTMPVTAIIGDGRYVWFTWNNYDASSTGLGKMDLSTFIAGDPLAPAYASDIMVTGQGVINSLDWDPVTNTPLMAVGGLGIYGPYATNEGGLPSVSKYVSSGSITSGVFDYGIPDPKIPVFLDIAGIAVGGSSIAATVVTNPNDSTSSASQSVSAFTSGGTSEFALAQNRGASFNTTIILNAGSSQTVSPVLNRWTLKSWPAVVQGTAISVVLQMFSVNVIDGLEVFLDPYNEFIWLETLRQNQDILTYQEGPMSVNCVVDGIDWIPHKRRDNWENGFEGDLVLTLKTITPYQYSNTSIPTEIQGL